MIYFISYRDGKDPELIETTNLCETLCELFQLSLIGFQISNVTIKTA